LNLPFLNILIVATITLSTLLVFALLTSKHSNKTANYLLSSLIVLFSYYALVKILSNSNGILHYPYLIRTYRPVFILACAMIYFYCKALTVPGFKFTCLDSLHLMPFGLYTLVMLPFFFSDSATKIASLSSQPFTMPWVIERSFWVIVFLSYLGFSYRIIHRHQQNIKDLFSNIEKIKLDWLKKLLLAFGVIWLTALFRFLTTHGNVGYENKLIVPLLLCLTIFLIGWYALRQPEIFSDRWDIILGENNHQSIGMTPTEENRQEKSISTKQTAKYEYSGLSEQDIAHYKGTLLNYLKQEKPYTNSDLKIQNLADHLGIPSYQLSQIINTELQQNFYDLINSFRISEATHMLIDPAKQHLRIIDIAYEVGFNSKSTFNTAFKKYTNLTPTQYKKSQLTHTKA